ncbi:MAG: alkaline phosphatase D family protein [Planctomycetota bacterium]
MKQGTGRTQDQLDIELLTNDGPTRSVSEASSQPTRSVSEATSSSRRVASSPPPHTTTAGKEIDPTDLLVFERETPQDEQVTAVAQWFAPRASTQGIQDPLAYWKKVWLPALQRRRVLPQQVPTSEIVATVLPKIAKEADVVLHELTTGGQVLEVNTNPNSQSKVVHVVLDADTWSAPETALTSALVQSRIKELPTQNHLFYRWSQSDWRRQGSPNVKKRNQLARRFYLLGETPEMKATIELLSVLRIFSRRVKNGTMSLAATERESLPMTLAALYAEQSAELRKVDRVYFHQRPSDDMLAATTLGLGQVCSFEQLHAALEQIAEVRSAPLAPLSPTLLIDASAEPKQANGMRIVEVSDRAATIWVRATRYDLPNLGDLPEVSFLKTNGKRSSGAVLPEQGFEGLRFAVPGVQAEVRVGIRTSGESDFRYSEWIAVDASSDFSALVPFDDLDAANSYSVRTQVRAGANKPVHTLTGNFKTLPAADSSSSFKLAVSSCQAFADRDGPHGFDMYRTIQQRGTDAFVMAGNVVYYDRLARSPELAYYLWQRTYSLPTVVDFHRRVPSYFLKDDHGAYLNTDDFTFVDGQKIFTQETGLPSPAFRTFRVGKELQFWLMTGRDFRSPNTDKGGPEKTIWGTQQKAWLKETLEGSDTKFKVVISPTPLVSPNRKNEEYNHSNAVSQTEGREVRKLIASFPNTVSVCGDRHGQFHCFDPVTGLHEFSVGPASDRHAGGWKEEDYRTETHRYSRVAGGYLEIELTGGEQSVLILRHLDTSGTEHHRHVLN